MQEPAQELYIEAVYSCCIQEQEPGQEEETGVESRSWDRSRRNYLNKLIKKHET